MGKKQEKKNCYAVHWIDEKKDFVVKSWTECQKLIEGHNTMFKGFMNEEQANGWLASIMEQDERKHNEIVEKLKIRRMDIDNFRYLNGLSLETRNLVMGEVKAGNKNLYHSVMAVLMHRCQKGRIRTVEKEVQSYINRYDIDIEIQPLIEELVHFCYKRVMNKNQYKKGDKESITLTLKERVTNLEREIEELKKQIELLKMK